MVTDMDTAHITAGDGECITIPIDLAMVTQVLVTGVQDTMATVATLLITTAEEILPLIMTGGQPEAVT